MTNTASILGINGRIGSEIAKAFVSAGWHVTGFGRTDRTHIPGVRFVAGDAENPADIRRATEGADIVVNALNLPYDKWENGRAEALLASVLDGLKGSKKTLMFPGNIYNYAAKQHVIEPQTPQHPEKEKGHIRARMETMLETAAAAGDIRVIIVRTGDFYAPGAVGTNFDLAILARIKSGVLQYFSDPSIGHTWAYLPDVARAYVGLAEARAEFSAFENFHFEGHFATGHELIDIVQSVLAHPAKVRQLPWSIMGVIGWFVPVVRELVKMRYLYSEPQRLVDPQLEAILGAGFHTPFEQAVQLTARSYLPVEKQRDPAGTVVVPG